MRQCLLRNKIFCNQNAKKLDLDAESFKSLVRAKVLEVILILVVATGE